MALTATQRAAADAAYAADPTVSRVKLARLCGCAQYSAERYLKLKRAGSTPAAPASDARISVADFQKKFDYVDMLRRTLDRICRKDFVSETDIRAACDIPVAAFKTVAGLPEFQKCQIRDGGVTWWSTAANCDVVRASAKKWGITK